MNLYFPILLSPISIKQFWGVS